VTAASQIKNRCHKKTFCALAYPFLAESEGKLFLKVPLLSKSLPQVPDLHPGEEKKRLVCPKNVMLVFSILKRSKLFFLLCKMG
jgi:hypothetical protein